MAEAVSTRAQALERGVATAGWWPQDRLIFSYLLVSGLLVGAFFRQIPGAGWLLTWHAAAAWLLAAVARAEATEGSLAWFFRHWYPLLYVSACYREMSVLIPAIRRRDFDAALARLDFTWWGAHPTVWLERLTSPLLTELMQFIYILFLPMILVPALLLWRRRRWADFRFYAFLLSLGFLVSYLGYFLVPVRGPRFLLDWLQSAPLEGLWSFPFLRHWLDVLEAAHYDCFPSGHTELILMVCWFSRRLSGRLFALFSVYTVPMLFSTVYLRYHYTVDLVAGATLALVLILLAPRLYGIERERGFVIAASRPGS